MKTLFGTALVVAGLTFGGSNAFANPTIGCGCSLVDRSGHVGTYYFPDLEHEEITLAESGNIDANCKIDFGAGTQTTWNNANTEFPCLLTGAMGAVIASTTDWQEVISANGQTTLQCHFH